MPFGICKAPEYFHRHVNEIIEGLEGVAAIADGLLVTGAGDTHEEALADHDRNLIALLQRFSERNFKLNKDKFVFKQQKLKYCGHVLTSEGILPDPAKVEAITQMPIPRSKTEVRRLLGMINYLGKFLPQLSDVSEPLRNLTKEQNQFIWSNVHQDAFNKLTQLISEPPPLCYYDLEEVVTIETNASDYGLGTVLLQAGRPVTFAGRTMTETERRYSQIEKECLALLCGCTRFDHYLHRREKITAVTDHMPQETILAKSINSAPKRLQRMMLRLQKYRLNIVYKKGTQMYISDHLSRSALPNGRTQKKEIDDYEVFTIHAEELLMKEIEGTDPNIFHNMTDTTLQKVVTTTSQDGNLMTLAETIANGWPEDKTQVPPNVRDYWPYRDELAVQDGIIYRGTRVLIPTALRLQMLGKNRLRSTRSRGMHETCERYIVLAIDSS